jgi:hypothetical protein
MRWPAVRRFVAIALAASVALCALPGSAAADAAPGTQPDAGRARAIEVRAWLGDRSQFAGMFTTIPAMLSLAVAVDLRVPMRLELQICWNPLLGGVQTTASGGVPFALYDGRRSGASIFQLKLPAQIAFGYARGTWEAGDGYDDHVSWILLGPTVGLDFTWWVRESVGVCAQLAGSFLFRIADPGSRYPGSDFATSASHKIGIGEIIVSVGMAFD